MDMIERVARSLCAVGGTDPDASAGWLLQPKRKLWENHVEEARAAIVAMREPTEDMLNAGAYGSGEGSPSVARGAWEQMIDAALSTELVS